MDGRAAGEVRDIFGIVGTVVDGRYRVERMAGEGGFGAVYRANHLGFEWPIALKVLKLPGQWTPERTRARVAAFQREGKVLFELSALHMSILRAFETGTITLSRGSAVPYLALEWLEGVSLADELRFRRERGLGPFALDEVLALLNGPATALALAHRRGIVHRDIKPGNLFVTSRAADSTVKILDFGIAKIIDEALDAADEGGRGPNVTAAFTPLYAAPEQWQRQLGPTSSATDVHGLALVCVELLSGRAPFDGAGSTELRAACLDGALRPTPKRRGVELPSAVEAVFERAVTLDPSSRFSEVDAFWSELCRAASWTPRAVQSVTLQALSSQSAPLSRPSSTSISIPTSRDASSTAPTLAAPRAPGSRSPRRAAGMLTAVVAISLGFAFWHAVLQPSASPGARETKSVAGRNPPLSLASLAVTEAASDARTAAPDAPVTPLPAAREAKSVARMVRTSSLVSAMDLLEHGDIAGACRQGEAALSRAPDCAACAEFLGRCYMRLGDKTRSRESYRRYLVLEPKGKDAVFVRAIVEPNDP